LSDSGLLPDRLETFAPAFIRGFMEGRHCGRPSMRFPYLVAHFGRVQISVQPRASLTLMNLLLS
jgi:hypothetical protein